MPSVFFSFPVLILPVALSMERRRRERQRAGERNEVETTGKRITFYVCGNALTFPILL